MKQLFFFVIAGFIISACSNSGNKTKSGDQTGQNEIVITNDLENALAKIPSWKGDVTVFDMKNIAHSGGFVSVTNDTLEYGYTYNELFKNINVKIPKRVIYSGWVYTTTANPKFSIVCSINKNNKLYDWKIFPLEKVLSEPGKWVEFTTSFYFDPTPLNPEDEISIFAWNESKKTVYTDDLKITFFY